MEFNTNTKFDNHNIISHPENILLRNLKTPTQITLTDHQNGNNNTKSRNKNHKRKSNHQTTVDKNKIEPTNFNSHENSICIFGDSKVKSVNDFKLIGKVVNKCIIKVRRFSG